jgi:hypothetical protein
MEMKLGNGIHLQQWPDACLPDSSHFLQSVIPRAVMAASFVNIDHLVSLHLQAEEDQFRRLL